MANIRHSRLTENNIRKSFGFSVIQPPIQKPIQKPILDTLAQLDHNPYFKPTKSERKAPTTLEKRAISKYYTNKIIYPLIDLKNDREKRYWKTFHCVNNLQQDIDGTVRSEYCKNRWCVVCGKIKSAIQINGYLPSIKQWKDIRFLTLSRPTVSYAELPGEIQLRQDVFANVWRRTKRKYPNTEMIRKLEITWNWKTQLYHPHYHVLLNDYEASNYFLNEWLTDFPTALRDKGNKDIQGDQNSVKELFKYMTKMWNSEKDTEGKTVKVLPYPAQIMDNIFRIMYRKRTIQTYGKIRRVDDDFENENATVFLKEERLTPILWTWEQEAVSWVDKNTGELRTDGLLEDELRKKYKIPLPKKYKKYRVLKIPS